MSLPVLRRAERRRRRSRSLESEGSPQGRDSLIAQAEVVDPMNCGLKIADGFLNRLMTINVMNVALTTNDRFVAPSEWFLLRGRCSPCGEGELLELRR